MTMTKASIQKKINDQQKRLNNLKTELEQSQNNLIKMQNARNDLEKLSNDFENDFFRPSSQINNLIGMDPRGLEGVKMLQDPGVKLSYRGQFLYVLSSRMEQGLQKLKNKIEDENEKISRCIRNINDTGFAIERLKTQHDNAPY